MTNNKVDRQAAIAQLRDRFKGDKFKLPDTSDDFFNKWLIVRNYDVDQTEKALLHTLEWRKRNRIDEILATHSEADFPIPSKYYSFSVIGRDKLDGPLVFLAYGKTDHVGILKSVTKNHFLKFDQWKVEGMVQDLWLANRPNSPYKKTGNQATLLMDMDGLSMKVMTYKPAVDVMLEQFRVFETHYPDCLRRIFFINVSKVFYIFLGLMKPLLNKTTAESIKIFGTNKEEWLPALLEEIDADQLPACYGGKMTDPNGDPKCPSKMNLGLEVPKELYLSKNKPVPKQGMTAVSIGKASKKKIPFQVESAGSILRWEFMTEDGEDIAFKIGRKESNKDDVMVDIVPSSRVQSGLMMEEGEIICDEPGTYVFELDNGSSYLTSKKVHYAIAVTAA